MLSQTPKTFSNQLPVFFQKNKYWAKLLITRCNYILNNFVEWWTFSHCSLLINLGYLCLLQPRCHGKLARLVSISQTWVSQHSWLFFPLQVLIFKSPVLHVCCIVRLSVAPLLFSVYHNLRWTSFYVHSEQTKSPNRPAPSHVRRALVLWGKTRQRPRWKLLCVELSQPPTAVSGPTMVCLGLKWDNWY